MLVAVGNLTIAQRYVALGAFPTVLAVANTPAVLSVGRAQYRTDTFTAVRTLEEIIDRTVLWSPNRKIKKNNKRENELHLLLRGTFVFIIINRYFAQEIIVAAYSISNNV